MIADGDPALLSAALGDITKARGMTQIAKHAASGPKRQTSGRAAVFTEVVNGARSIMC